MFCVRDGADLVNSSTDPLVGKELDRYLIEERLGEGGMGCVYRARHTVLDREYAIKVLFADFADDDRFLARFRREAQSMGKMRHRHVVSVEDFGTSPTGETFLVMEYVQGLTLEQIIDTQGPLPAPRAGLIAKQMALGLATAHAGGFVHRDIKPANIMISRQGTEETVKILDFGAVSLRSLPTNERLTNVGHIIGTPTYMAPEQSQDPNVGPTADLYALGAVLFEMLTKSPPFTGAGRAEVLVKHITQEAPAAPPSQGLERLVAQLLRKQPCERPQTGEAVVAIIDGLDLTSSDNEVTTINEVHPFPMLTQEPQVSQDWGAPPQYTPAERDVDADTDEQARVLSQEPETLIKPAAFAATHVVRERITPARRIEPDDQAAMFPVVPAPLVPLDDDDDGAPTQVAAGSIEISPTAPEPEIAQLDLRPLINAQPLPMRPTAATDLDHGGHLPLANPEPPLPGFLASSDTLPLTDNAAVMLAPADLAVPRAPLALPISKSTAAPQVKPPTPLLHYLAVLALLLTILVLGWALWPAQDTVRLVPGQIIDEL